MTLARNRVNEVYIEKNGPTLRARCRCISHIMQCTIYVRGQVFHFTMFLLTGLTKNPGQRRGLATFPSRLPSMLVNDAP